MTPRYRTAFSVPSGFSASTAPVTQPTASVGSAKARKSSAIARPQGKPGVDKKALASPKSAAA